MISEVSESKCHEEYRGYLYISAEDQTWDEATLRQLREEHHVFFATNGDGVIPVMVDRGGVVLGVEDDGTISFEKYPGGGFAHEFHPFWINALIADLNAAKEFCDSLARKED